jgi:predicted transcriptional regulator
MWKKGQTRDVLKAIKILGSEANLVEFMRVDRKAVYEWKTARCQMSTENFLKLQALINRRKPKPVNFFAEEAAAFFSM